MYFDYKFWGHRLDGSIFFSEVRALDFKKAVRLLEIYEDEDVEICKCERTAVNLCQSVSI